MAGQPVLETISDIVIEKSPIHGSGVFTTRNRQKGEILTVLDGQVIAHGNDLDFLTAHEWNAISNDEILLRPVWTTYGYINHAVPGNLTFHLVDQTLRMAEDVTAGDELTLNYLEHGIPQAYLASEHGKYLR